MDVDSSTETLTITRKVKYALTLSVYFCYFAYGLGFSVLGPTLLDIKDLVGTGLAEISYGLVVRSAVYCLGALICGWAFNLYNRQICFSISCLCFGLSLVVIPHVRDLMTYVGAQGMIGFASAGIDVAGNAWLLEMWQENSNPYMQGLHFSYALGSTLSPLLAEPFLSPDRPPLNISGMVNVSDPHQTIPFVNITDYAQQSQIQVPYSIVASVSFLASILLLTLYFLNPYKDPLRTLSHLKSSQSMEITDESVNLIPMRLPRSYFVTIIILGGSILCFYAGIELNTFTYLPAFAVNIDLHLSKSTGAFMTSVTSASYTVSRGLSIFLATRFKTTTLLYFNFSIIGVGNLLVLRYANSSETMLWVGLIVMGFGFSSVFPGIYAFLEERINVTNTVCGFFMFASSLATTINPIIEGKYIEKYPLTFVYINIVSLICCIGLFIGLHHTDQTKSRLIGKPT